MLRIRGNPQMKNSIVVEGNPRMHLQHDHCFCLDVDMTSLDALPQMRANSPLSKVRMITGNAGRPIVEAAATGGAKGYFLKSNRPSKGDEFRKNPPATLIGHGAAATALQVTDRMRQSLATKDRQDHTVEWAMKCIAMAVLSSVTLLAHAAALDYYKEGTICDRKAGFCADHMGVSLGLTKLYLGEKTEQELLAKINKVGSDWFNPTIFTMSGGLTCNTEEKQCWTSKFREKPHDKATKTLFKK